MKISIIGCGNIGRALAKGLIKSGFTKHNELILTRRRAELLDEFKYKNNVSTTDINLNAIKGVDIIVLAVQPIDIERIIIEDIKPWSNENQILVSLATGVSIYEITNLFTANKAKQIPMIFRAMPNTAMAICESMTCISTECENEFSKNVLSTVFRQVGDVAYIKENLMQAATVIAASGTAFALRYIRAAMQGGIDIGFDSKDALKIVKQTVKGAAAMLENNSHPEAEIDKVTTPKGCTIKGLNEMERQGFSAALIQGIEASYNKINKNG